LRIDCPELDRDGQNIACQIDDYRSDCQLTVKPMDVKFTQELRDRKCMPTKSCEFVCQTNYECSRHLVLQWPTNQEIQKPCHDFRGFYSHFEDCKRF
jgi:hypothetical protein